MPNMTRIAFQKFESTGRRCEGVLTDKNSSKRNMKDKVVEFIRSHILGKYMSKYKNETSYPVITGGTSVSRCSPDIRIADIDVVFAIIPHDPSDETIDKVSQDRDKFLHDITTDKALLKMTKPKGYKLVLRETYKIHPEYRVSMIKLVRLQLVRGDKKDVIIDTSVQCNKTIRIWNLYSKRYPIPFWTKNGVLYATCEYAKFDTLRLVLFYEGKDEADRFRKYLTRYLFITKRTDLLGTGSDEHIIEQLRSTIKFRNAEKHVRSIVPHVELEIIIKV